MIDQFIPLPNQVRVQEEIPSTTIRLYSGVPLDPSYSHVRGMLSQSQINAFLENYKVKELTQIVVVLMGDAVIDMPMNEYETLNCNYIAWHSPSFNNRWHYGFLISAVRLSDRSCRIYFEKDVWNENQDQFQLRPSFIERMIIPKSEDIIGAYTFPEGLELGDYVMDDMTAIPKGTDRRLKIWGLMNFNDLSYEPAKGQMVNGVYQGLRLTQFSSEEAVNTMLSYATENNKQDGVLSIFMMPEGYRSGENSAPLQTLSFTRTYNNIDGYTPKNNKCFVYPYSFLVLDNNSGNQLELHWELFENNQNIQINYGIALNGGNPILYAFPNDYAGMNLSYNYFITFNQFPKCSYTTDYYKAWLAQNASGQNIRMAFSAIRAGNAMVKGIAQGAGAIAAGAATGGMGTAAAAGMGAAQGISQIGDPLVDTFETAFNILNERKVAQLQPDCTKQSGGTGANGEIGNCYIAVRHAHVRREYIKKIDNFFSVFGYQIGEIRTPDLTSRPNWNYVKCTEINLGGIAEQDDLIKLRSIFRRGVTVWHTNDIGNYTLNNG